MVAFHPYTKAGGYQTQDDSSPKSMRRAAALAANPLPWIARMITVTADCDVTITRPDGTSDTVWCVAGHNPYMFIRLEADAAGFVKDVHA